MYVYRKRNERVNIGWKIGLNRKEDETVNDIYWNRNEKVNIKWDILDRKEGVIIE